MKPTLKQLIASTNIPATLIRSTVRQFGGWQQFTQSAPDVCRGGIDGGFGKFVYHTDTVAFTKRNRKHIISLATNQADDFGQGMIEMFSGFNCMKGETFDDIAQAVYSGRGDASTTVLNCLAWYAGEEVCRAYCDMVEVER